ncbi:2Fe-2S iron-sulfur cluster-binding protein [Dietzia kunjamensis]|uniref:2Fe-2S iron-sulfur cluster-binding protein n=1 Tax=Dietzia kunjamensis TaxID=322509 RepID=UPI0032AEB62F
MASAISVAGRRVECIEDQSILESLLRAGVWMPNSCNQGTCGTCKLQVLSGEVDHRDSPQDTLSAEERTQGLALACQARPLRDTEVALCGSKEARSTHVLRDLAGTVTGVEEIARDTRRILLDLDEALDFSAGQYIELTVPGTIERRQYSLANTAEENKVLELHVRRVPGGLASDQWLFGTIAVGDRVEGLGPLGDFHAPPAEEDTGEPMVLIGGGTGLAPLVGIVRTALARHPNREVVLYHGVRGESDLYDGGVFAELGASYDGFRFVPVLSDETSPDHRSGFPTDAFLEDIPSSRGWSGWLCGPPPMVEAGVKAFKRRRMTPRLIHREKFTPADALTSA